MKISETIRDMRYCRGWTQAELARRTGLTVNYISLLENGNRVPSWPTVLLLVKACGYKLLVECDED